MHALTLLALFLASRYGNSHGAYAYASGRSIVVQTENRNASITACQAWQAGYHPRKFTHTGGDVIHAWHGIVAGVTWQCTVQA